MKFVFNFIFYGVIFFLIWRYFPEAFNTLVSWVNGLWDFIVDLVVSIVAKVKGAMTSGGGNNQALLLPFVMFASLFKR